MSESVNVGLNDDQKNRLAIMEGEFRSLFDSLMDYMPDGRYKSLVITYLEIADMFVHKGIATEAASNQAAQVTSTLAEVSEEIKTGCCGGNCSKE